ncbi:flagellin [Thiomicrospira sp. ALE5]|uniref:flagellin N-terminal helical domain-containing protein n=1 Tax=Thiomicrospira sp. ALE5 TaxID=748650 RepID=UPI0008E570F7|nr:flagellin [Thiomicrospira sp. ALE5]SFR54155.1 flagellin [Thiomicrospira sp. ALE5]
MSTDAISNSRANFSNLSSTTASMTSGSQINRAADNPSGLAVANGLTTDINSQSTGLRNAADGISILQTANGATQGITVNLQRMYELSIQSMNGTLNDSQRNLLDSEFQQGLQEINRIIETTQFNGVSLFNGENPDINLALGDSSSTLTMPTLNNDLLSLNGLSISNLASASASVDSLKTAIETMSSTQAEFGAQQNGLLSAISNMATGQTNDIASRSQILDTDFARASVSKAREDILNQAGIMMLAQGNQDKANILQLIR